MKLRVLLYAVGGFVWAALPLVASAALVPCGLNNDAAATCNICTLGALIQNIINFVIGLSIPLSAVLFSYAGWLYFSNRDNPSKIEQAHRIFISVLIGFVIAIGAWLIIQTVLKTLAPGYQSWTTFTCNATRIGSTPGNSTNLGQLFGQAGLPGLSTTAPAPIQTYNYNDTKSDVVQCQAGSTWSQGALNCVNTDGEITAPLAINSGNLGPLSSCSNSGCNPSAYEAAGFSPQEAQAMACIAMTENSGNSGGCNGNACGALQIMLTINPLVGPSCAKYNPTGGETLNCPALCKGKNGVAVKYEQSCQPCVQAAQDAACNAEAAQYLYNQSGYSPWLSGENGGSSDNTKSGACVVKYDPNSDSL